MSLLALALAQADTATAAAAGASGLNYDTPAVTIASVAGTVTSVATTAGAGVINNVSNALDKVNWVSPTWDVFIVLFFVVTVFLYGISLGRDRILVILVSIYMALAVVSNAPFLMRSGTNFALRATIFIGVFLLLFFLVSRTALTKIFGSLASGKLWQVLLFSTLQVGLLVSITLSFLPPEAIEVLHPITRTIFASSIGRFGWVSAPIVAMIFFTGDE